MTEWIVNLLLLTLAFTIGTVVGKVLYYFFVLDRVCRYLPGSC